ncbi:MAG: ferritin family protein [Proteobacteria bacterium]|nr:ferritin family protein [Pseudomonadota bacterium]
MDRMASIEMALKNEIAEREFYINEARRSRNELAKRMFAQLAKDEEEHMHRIRALHEKLISQGNWPKDMPIEVAGTNVKQILDGIVTKAGTASDHDDDDLKALSKAIDFEAKGVDLYNRLTGLCQNPMEKNFFSFLAGIEREHHRSLVDALAYLKDPEGWMMQSERAGLDGA